ncbi:MAG: 4-hydroxy-tetrahydrodipicolinate synthase [Alphaproteobacteria bacterium]|nr:4-hydroxy-tetrahydrodipicolinate synthase [Alphaproteobacteria bacterium]
MTFDIARLRGSIPALITPFRDGRVDIKAFETFVEWQIAEGTNGLVPCGTTGESPTLSEAEFTAVVGAAVKVAKGRVPVIAGTGSYSTAHAIETTQLAQKLGADVALVVTPYYNKPTQDGLYLHFAAIAEATRLPILIYNIPGRSVVDMTPDTMGRLAKISNIIGVKDATANMARVTQQKASCGAKFVQLSGEDGTALGFNAHGGVGCISVTANIAPRLCADFQAACTKGDYAKARELHERLMPLHDTLFCETSPTPVKYAASLLGKCEETVRLPLAPLSESSKAKVRAAMTKAGLLN